MLAVAQYDKAYFLAREKFFDDQARTRSQQRRNGLFGFYLVASDDNALARRKTVGFQDDRVAEIAKCGACIFRVFDRKKTGSWNSRALHELLRKRFAAFEACRRRRWPYDSQAGRAEAVHDARRERRFRTNNGQIRSNFSGDC